MIHWLTAFLDLPAGSVEADLAFWQAVTESTLSSRRGERSQFVTLVPREGDAYLRGQTVLDGTGGTHLDLHVDDPDETADRALSLGARQRHRRPGFAVLASPAGIGLCLVRHHGEVDRPAPVRRMDGARSVVDQLCLDIPPDVYERECAFWSALTGWSLSGSQHTEFQHLRGPEGMPLGLLLQRLDHGPAGAHLDLACDDADEEAVIHAALGASIAYRGKGWITLRDPAGLAYCVTRRNP